MSDFGFTDQVREILRLARVASARHHHKHVDPEHMLLALVAEGEGAGISALRNLGIDPNEVERRVAVKLRPGRSRRPTGPDLPYSSRAKKVLEFAFRESRGLEHEHVGSEHLVMGVLRETKGIAAQTLTEAGASIEALRGAATRTSS